VLKHIKSYYITPSIKPHAFHLGDMINVVQQTHIRAVSLPHIYYMFSNHICGCCKNDTNKTLKEILNLLKTPIHYLNATPEHDFIYMKPWWHPNRERNDFDYLPYTKVINLPIYKDKYVAVQFSSRTNKQKKQINKSDVRRITSAFKEVINLGDDKLDVWMNCGHYDVRQKLDIIAKARFYVGIDSGCTHLACMTNTPVFIIHPLQWPANIYYPKTDQIRYATSVKELLIQIRTSNL